MRFAGFWLCGIAVAATGCAGRHPSLVDARAARTTPEVSGVWDALSQTTIGDGAAAGDTRIEKQEWHLTQAGQTISGYYIAALTYLSGDGRPYLCSKQPQFSAMQRYDVSGRVRNGLVEIQEMGLEASTGPTRCDPGVRRLARYRGRLDGDVLTLIGGGEHWTLYRIHDPGATAALLAEAGETETHSIGAGRSRASSTSPADPDRGGDTRTSDVPPVLAPPPPSVGGASPASSSSPADVSGLWVWEHHGTVPGGDEKQEREEWHVTQEGGKLSGYYDRTVHQVSVDGHAYRCSMALDFQISTRYQFSGEVRGNEVKIYESSFEVLTPNACDNGKRRLDAYEGQASLDEIRLLWGVGGQILRRPRPDVPTQRF
jgi:hypothetical protein